MTAKAYEGALEDRIAIRERIDAYSDAVFRIDADDWIACWAEDSVWRLPGMETKGRANIKAAWRGAMTNYALAGFFATPGSIRISGDAAEARVYTQETLVLKAGGVTRIVGAYDDRLVREGGEWLFASRDYAILHHEEG